MCTCLKNTRIGRILIIYCEILMFLQAICSEQNATKRMFHFIVRTFFKEKLKNELFEVTVTDNIESEYISRDNQTTTFGILLWMAIIVPGKGMICPLLRTFQKPNKRHSMLLTLFRNAVETIR